MAPTNTLSPMKTSAESSYELLATLELSYKIQFFPIYIYEVSPLRVTPCQIEDPSPIFTFPIRTAFGATQSDNKLFGYFEFEIGIHLRDGYSLSECPISPWSASPYLKRFCPTCLIFGPKLYIKLSNL